MRRDMWNRKKGIKNKVGKDKLDEPKEGESKYHLKTMTSIFKILMANKLDLKTMVTDDLKAEITEEEWITIEDLISCLNNEECTLEYPG